MIKIMNEQEQNIINSLNRWVNKYKVSNEIKHYIVNKIMTDWHNSTQENKLIVFIDSKKNFSQIILEIDVTKNQIVRQIYQSGQEFVIYANIPLEHIQTSVRSAEGFFMT